MLARQLDAGDRIPGPACAPTASIGVDAQPARGFVKEDVAGILDAAFDVQRAMAAMIGVQAQQLKVWLPTVMRPLQVTR